MSIQVQERIGSAESESALVSLRKVASYFLLIAALFFANKLGAAGNAVAYGGLMLLAWRSVPGALQALTISGIILVGNPAFVDQTIVLSAGRFLLIFVAAARIVLEVRVSTPWILRMPQLSGLLIFSGTAAMLAPINDYFVLVALLKIVIFTIGVYAILAGAELRRQALGDLLSWLVAVSLFIVVVSLATIPLGVSHVVRNRVLSATGSIGLSGLTNQPQALGVFLSLIAIVAFSLFAFSRIPQRRLFFGFFLLLLPLLLLTKSRTAVFTLGLALLFAVTIAPVVVARAKGAFRPYSLVQFLMVGVPLLFGGFVVDFVTSGGTVEAVQEFLVKGRRDHSDGVTVDDIAWDRQRLVLESWNSFKESPMTGINFGTSRDPYFVDNATLISAPTEKGFIITAVLEEVGLIGAAALLFFVFWLFRRLLADGNIIGLSTLGGFLIFNLGEMTLFSLGGSGLFLWSIVGAAITLGNLCRDAFIAAQEADGSGLHERHPPQRKRSRTAKGARELSSAS